MHAYAMAISSYFYSAAANDPGLCTCVCMQRLRQRVKICLPNNESSAHSSVVMVTIDALYLFVRMSDSAKYVDPSENDREELREFFWKTGNLPISRK